MPGQCDVGTPSGMQTTTQLMIESDHTVCDRKDVRSPSTFDTVAGAHCDCNAVLQAFLSRAGDPTLGQADVRNAATTLLFRTTVRRKSAASKQRIAEADTAHAACAKPDRAMDLECMRS